ncbi:sugar-transfer associated ATP-grasp domain-containing protein [Sphingosinicella rhizophila]|uniref:Sugar-transfer associated ATP-grasp domain-containing protein n=1 Tax=Sphingosinicella rhizophila TaxID=3050082 RepID=A0ABU3Q3E4_9SPHN|nr:sugar-transfer associated ATP-grasp domain-containing protein [Sphingosinicella sp. GR2756]MDT9597933.1 sugar-transfer associated ATP-grasp domain-containing protein [Sphingosinicella sp. GR2756]
MGRFSVYRLKKAFALYPGVVAPVSADFLSQYYALRRRERLLPRALLDAVTGLLFRLWVPFRARQVARRYGLGDDWVRSAVRIGREGFADPNDLALFRIDRRQDLRCFMRRYEYAAISKRINPACWRDDCALADKILFYARAAEHDLPHPVVLATIVGGKARVASVPPGSTLAMKPADGEGGSGFRLIEWPGGDRAAFARFLEDQPGLGGSLWLVQAKMIPHQTLEQIALAALPTARITTIKDEQGNPELVTSVLRFPSLATAIVDNIKAGGLMAPIDPITGRLGPACRGKAAGEISRHPVTGGEVAGLRLPDWEAAKKLVLQAHAAAFPEYSMVGWDLAFTPDGPVFIEGNGKPCIVVAQRATGRGIGDTRFGQLVRHHLHMREVAIKP